MNYKNKGIELTSQYIWICYQQPFTSYATKPYGTLISWTLSRNELGDNFRRK